MRSAKQIAALKRAQAISARKRRGTGKRKPMSRRRKVAIAGGVAAVAVGAVATAAASGKLRSPNGGPAKGNAVPKALGPGKKPKRRLKTKNSGKRKRRVGKPDTSQKAPGTGRGKDGRRKAIESSVGGRGVNMKSKRAQAAARKRAARNGTRGGGTFYGKAKGRPVYQTN